MVYKCLTMVLYYINIKNYNKQIKFFIYYTTKILNL